MTKKECEAICNYFMRTFDRLEADVMQLQTNVRYRRVDIVDCMEMACAIERFNTFKDLMRDLNMLLKFSTCDLE